MASNVLRDLQFSHTSTVAFQYMVQCHLSKLAELVRVAVEVQTLQSYCLADMHEAHVAESMAIYLGFTGETQELEGCLRVEVSQVRVLDVDAIKGELRKRERLEALTYGLLADDVWTMA